ncbi:LytR C-terminal domain-containing protein [Actinoplanes sp. NEAU-A12]|uniref:LytR C-terminal domain-containing protein n=1 Tax=Actinoplanes sandaracinus TaxID=3045177 RepID=A0ABT6WU66_9ACTN|nr:LytR C-terminal domain-containing protein [Actinoplanes sandaracinus]MDI6103284.1 LytR C-terminal domain-containing protein [Actinoplanes sandaracinus]
MSFARVRALVVVGVLTVAAVVFVVVALFRDTQRDLASGGCPAGAPLADIRLPNDPAKVTIKVFNGTKRADLAEQVSNEFANRRFVVQEVGKTKTKVEGVAEIRYGPDTVGKAHLLQAYFLAHSTMVYNAKREGDVVDIIIGDKFQALATTTEVNQSLGAEGEPTLPPGACVKPAEKPAEEPSEPETRQ